MNKKVVLIVDENSQRVEKLVFMVRLGGYETRTFGRTAAALNWIKYGGSTGEILCLLFNHPGELEKAEEIFTAWYAAGMTVPVVLVQRGSGYWHHTFNIDKLEHFFVCQPEGVMQTLDILSVIEYSDDGIVDCQMKALVRGEKL